MTCSTAASYFRRASQAGIIRVIVTKGAGTHMNRKHTLFTQEQGICTQHHLFNFKMHAAEEVLTALAEELGVLGIINSTNGTNICNWSTGPIQVYCQNVMVDGVPVARAQQM